MSQCYHIELKQAVTRVVRAEDAVSYPIELTAILPAGEMQELLREVLTKAGWKSADDNDFAMEGPSGEVLSIDLDAMELTATLTAEKEVVAEVKAAGQGNTTRTARRSAQIQIEEKAAATGDQIADSGQREIQKETTDRLNESEDARQRQMNELLQQVYTEALKRKAGQLGDIVEIQEGTGEDGNYELLIRVAQ